MSVEQDKKRSGAKSGKTAAAENPGRAILEGDQLQSLLDALRRRGYRLIGPTVRDSAIVYDDLESAADLPAGWTDQQDGGTYRLTRKKSKLLFNYTVGPQSFKKFLHLPVLRLWQSDRKGAKFTVTPESMEPPQMAFIGVRSCDLAAIARQDRVLLNDLYRDPFYQRQRERNFIVAVNCGKAGGTCFCVSMQTGPKAESGFDLALTEVLEDARHYFVVESGSPAGSDVLRELSVRDAEPKELEAAEKVTAAATRQMGRKLDTTNIKELDRAVEHPRYEDVARRCMTCGNCTLVCPTCFCTTVEDVTDLTGQHAERWRKWDSCFTLDFSYIHGGSIRTTGFARYRKWLTHKLASWYDQYGSSGCVGCGRCITWCPVGIDITEEARAIRESESARPTMTATKE